MELELVIGTIRKGIKSAYLNAYIDLRYRLSGKSYKIHFLFSAIFA